MTHSERLLEMAELAGQLAGLAELERMDDEKRTLDLVCLHHRLGLLINSYSQQRAREEARGGSPLALASPMR